MSKVAIAFIVALTVSGTASAIEGHWWLVAMAAMLIAEIVIDEHNRQS